MIKKVLLISFITFCFLVSAFGQSKCPVKKVYAYKQVSLPGIQPRTVVNGGKERKETFNYWLYLTLPKSKSISISHIWISGQKFSVKSEEIESTPVIKNDNSTGTENELIELVPATKHKLILFYPSGMLNESGDLSDRIRKKIGKNELVISFTWKNKKRLAKKKLIKILSPEPLS